MTEDRMALLDLLRKGEEPAAPSDADDFLRRSLTWLVPHLVEAMVSRADKLIDEAILVRVAGSKEVVTAAVVTVSLKDTAGITVAAYPARLSGGLYEVRYPPAQSDGWRVQISILGSQGTVVVEHPFTAPAREWTIATGLTGLILNVASVLVIFVGLPLFAYRVWFRQPAAAGTTNAGDPPRQPAEG